MGELANVSAPEALHAELCAAIADLAKSVDIAVSQIALRAKFTVVIADAAKAERAAEALRAAAFESSEPAWAEPAEASEDREVVSLVPVLTTTGRIFRDFPPDVAPPIKAVDELYDACNWLTTAQSPLVPEQQAPPRESAIAARIVELHDRFGGLIK